MTSLSEKSINNSLTRANKTEIIHWGMPDYESSVSVTSGFICPSDGIVRAYAYDNGIVDYDLKNEDAVIGHASASAGQSQNNTSYLFVFKGNTLTQKRKSGNSVVTFYPLKGI